MQLQTFLFTQCGPRQAKMLDTLALGHLFNKADFKSKYYCCEECLLTDSSCCFLEVICKQVYSLTSAEKVLSSD